MFCYCLIMIDEAIAKACEQDHESEAVSLSQASNVVIYSMSQPPSKGHSKKTIRGNQ